MPYTTGSLGADANAAKTFMEGALHTALIAVYTYVEEVANANERARVYKSLAANNVFGQDWYLIVYRSSDTATNIDFRVTELYNSSTHLCNNYAPSTTNLTPTASYAVNDATGKAPYATQLGSPDLGSATAGFTYFISVTGNRVVVATRYGTTDNAVYAGLYEDMQPVAVSPFPLIVSELRYSSSSSFVSFGTREPNTLSANTNNFQSITQNSYAFWNWLRTNETYTGKNLISRITVMGRSGVAFRGLLRDIWGTSVGGANGDTMATTIDGVAKTLVQAADFPSLGSVYTFVDTGL